MCIVHTSSFSNLKSHKMLKMPEQPETYGVCKMTIPLLILQISDLYVIPTRFYESLNELAELDV